MGAVPIKIAHVITRMDWGGSPDIVRILCERLDPEIYEVRLIYGPTLHSSKKTRDFFKKFKDNTYRMPYLRRDINIFIDTFALFSLYRLFRKERFDIVHTHTAKAGAVGRIAAHLAGIPRVVHSPHGHNFYGYFGLLASKMIIFIERILSAITDRVAVLTELEKADFIKFRVAGKEKIVVINSGLELKDYKHIHIDSPPGRPADSPLGRPTDRAKKRDEFKAGRGVTLVGMIGRLEPVKGPGYLIDGAKLVIDRFPQVKFLIVGEGSLRGELESRCRKLGIRNKIIFAGWREDIPEILSILDILVLPSLNEAVGRVLIEAGACGVPVVAARVGGVPEIVRDNETGILVRPKDPDSLARGIIALLEDRDKRLRFGEASKKWVDEKFSVERMVKNFSDLYKNIL